MCIDTESRSAYRVYSLLTTYVIIQHLLCIMDGDDNIGEWKKDKRTLNVTGLWLRMGSGPVGNARSGSSMDIYVALCWKERCESSGECSGK